jgi:alpha-L-rhamnosidase
VDGLETRHAAIHSTVYALANGVADGAPGGVAEAAWATLVGRLNATSGIPTGPYPGLFYGEALFRNASDHGRAAIARFLLNNGTNSWLSQLRQGATTTMESWTPEEKPNLTWSHPWMAFPLSLITRWLLGVRPLSAGFAQVLVQPQPGPLARAGGVVPTPRGPVAVAVAQALGPDLLPTAFWMNLTLPGGVRGTACAPLPACAGGRVVVDGAGVAGAVSGDYACVQLGEGAHQLACP